MTRINSRPPISKVAGSSLSVGGSVVDGLAGLEGEGHPAIGVDGGVVQQACPYAFPEFSDFAVLLLQELQGILHFGLIGLFVGYLLSWNLMHYLGDFKPLAQDIEALLVAANFLYLLTRCLMRGGISGNS